MLKERVAAQELADWRQQREQLLAELEPTAPAPGEPEQPADLSPVSNHENPAPAAAVADDLDAALTVVNKSLARSDKPPGRKSGTPPPTGAGVMTEKLDAIVPKMLPLLRMLSSGTEGEVLNAVRALLRLLASIGLDIHALADRIERRAPLSAAEMQRIYDAGYQRGLLDGTGIAQPAPPPHKSSSPPRVRSTWVNAIIIILAAIMHPLTVLRRTSPRSRDPFLFLRDCRRGGSSPVTSQRAG